MRVLVVGGGAREHALIWKLAGERSAGELICAPGNPGIAGLARCVPVDAARPDAILDLARRESADLTLIGPEAPLAAGVADRFQADGRPLLGPSQAAARLESSKIFAKTFMARHDVPTADFLVCDSPAEAFRVLDSGRFGFPVVVKADGLAAGKGVVVAGDLPEARDAVQSFMVDRIFGEAGDRVLLERCLVGVEASFFVLSDGRDAVPLLSAQDHKRVFDEDRGPNTGGMGAFSPSPLVTPPLADRIMREIVAPTLSGMAADGHPFAGILYVGLMLTADGPQVIEYNVRFGDPEAQVILPAIAEDLLPWFAAAASGRLGKAGAGQLRLRSERHVGLVLASGGYPGAFEKGQPIAGLDAVAGLDDVFVFHAGTARLDGRIVTAGGRVLTVVARGDDYQSAIHRAYDAAARISFEGMHYRRDIGRQAL